MTPAKSMLNIRCLRSRAEAHRGISDVSTFKERVFPSWKSRVGWRSPVLRVCLRKSCNGSIGRSSNAPAAGDAERLELEAFEIKLLDPNAFTTFVEIEIERWAPIAKGALAKR